MLLTSSDTKRTLMHLFLFTKSAQRELVSICTQSIQRKKTIRGKITIPMSFSVLQVAPRIIISCSIDKFLIYVNTRNSGSNVMIQW